MTILLIVLTLAVIAGAGWWLFRPDVTAYFWALAGNSRTIAVAYAAELLGLLDELKLVDWSSWFGSERAGKIMMAMGVVMVLLRLVTRTAVSFKPQG
jgi:hypothetical protein